MVREPARQFPRRGPEAHSGDAPGEGRSARPGRRGDPVHGDGGGHGGVGGRLGNYYLARYYEEMGEPKKAMRTYQSAYTFEEIGGITKDFMLEKADEIKADFGY